MENKHATYSPAFHLISWIALIGGIVTYLVGLWNADMQLNEKGYYFAVLVLGCLPRHLIKRRCAISMKPFRPRAVLHHLSGVSSLSL
ncbi:inner membrane protein YiaA [Klebsiella pneumoniae]|uniref:Inner membrane protein YiaA n=1 Tax=Klebsiella pneumoniae TaxID=573 RepID=A0A377U554_KLEPN|nr:inner membrane protein YiaA [Klebsiella pneumoniae]